MFKLRARLDATRADCRSKVVGARCIEAGALWGALALCGCGAIPSVMPPVAPSQSSSPSQASASNAPGAKVAAARSRSLERALAGINAQTVRAWIDRYSAPQSATTSQAPPRAIRIDIDALARRHVAWQLADALQSGAIAPTPARQIAVRLPPFALANSGAKANSNAGEMAIPSVGDLPTLAARTVSATVSQRGAIVASRATLDDFLSDLRARQNDLESAESELARRALEDRIRAATRGAVEAISLTPVSPETALELSNLRLQLLAQVRAPASDKAAAAAKIESIEARLNAIWEAQTAEQNARLRAALEELPARLRREGLQALDAAAAKRESERYYARLELRGLIENRLNSATPNAADTQTLRLLLPQARVANVDLNVKSDSSSRTNARDAASVLPGNNEASRNVRDARSLSQSARADGASLTTLRAQARADARQWARKLALSWDAQLSENPSAPDRTALALQKLFAR